MWQIAIYHWIVTFVFSIYSAFYSLKVYRFAWLSVYTQALEYFQFLDSAHRQGFFFLQLTFAKLYVMGYSQSKAKNLPVTDHLSKIKTWNKAGEKSFVLIKRHAPVLQVQQQQIKQVYKAYVSLQSYHLPVNYPLILEGCGREFNFNYIFLSSDSSFISFL